MKWWRTSYEARLEERLTYLEERARQAEARCLYWQQKAERLLDAALFKRGEIVAPVFEPDKPAPTSSLLGIIAAMNTTETDTSKRMPLASPAMPMTPMK